MSQNLVHFCCATYLDQVLTQPWTRFWLNNFANFGVFLPVLKCTKTTIFIVFSAKKKEILSPPQKIKEHYLWTQSRYFFFFAVLFFCIFAFWGFCCVRFFGGSFFERNEKTKKDKIQNKTTKKQKRKKDHKMQTKRPLSLVTKNNNTEAK